MAIYTNLNLDQGSTFTTTVIVEGPDGIVDLTNYIAAAQLRRSYKSVSSIDFDVVIVSPASLGRVVMKLTAEQTSTLKEGRYVFDLEIKNTVNGEVYRVVEGQIIVNPGVTRTI